jgi:hypothetical protein
MDDTSKTFTVESLRMTGGLAVWGIHLAAVYGWGALACARGWADRVLLGTSAVAFGVAAATLPALAACAWLLAASLRARRLRGRDDPRRFHDGVAAWSAAFGLVATTWTALVAAIVVPPCP